MSENSMPDIFGEMDADIRVRLEAAGLTVGREQQGLMLSIERGDRRVWYDVGWTTRVVGDASDPGNELLLDVIEMVSGIEARQRMESGS